MKTRLRTRKRSKRLSPNDAFFEWHNANPIPLKNAKVDLEIFASDERAKAWNAGVEYTLRQVEEILNKISN